LLVLQFVVSAASGLRIDWFLERPDAATVIDLLSGQTLHELKMGQVRPVCWFL
jgi:hypothetical protein